jgi:hypothetical protein
LRDAAEKVKRGALLWTALFLQALFLGRGIL